MVKPAWSNREEGIGLAKTGPRSEDKQTRFGRTHVHRHVYLSKQEARLLDTVCKRRGFAGFSEFVHAAIREMAIRMPESQGRVRVELVPEVHEQFIATSQRVLAQQGNALHDAMQGEPNLERRAEIRAESTRLLDAAFEWSTILQKLEDRRRLLDQEVVHPRHRYSARAGESSASSQPGIDAASLL